MGSWDAVQARHDEMVDRMLPGLGRYFPNPERILSSRPHRDGHLVTASGDRILLSILSPRAYAKNIVFRLEDGRFAFTGDWLVFFYPKDSRFLLIAAQPFREWVAVNHRRCNYRGAGNYAIQVDRGPMDTLNFPILGFFRELPKGTVSWCSLHLAPQLPNEALDGRRLVDADQRPGNRQTRGDGGQQVDEPA